MAQIDLFFAMSVIDTSVWPNRNSRLKYLYKPGEYKITDDRRGVAVIVKKRLLKILRDVLKMRT